MSYGSDSSLGVESGDDTEGHLSPGKYSSSIKRDRREQNNKSNWEKGLRMGEGRKYARHTPPEKVPIIETSILLKRPALTQVEIVPSPGNKTSGMASHEEGEFNMQHQPYTPGPSSQPPELATPPLKGSSARRDVRSWGRAAKVKRLPPRLEHWPFISGLLYPQVQGWRWKWGEGRDWRVVNP